MVLSVLLRACRRARSVWAWRNLRWFQHFSSHPRARIAEQISWHSLICSRNNIFSPNHLILVMRSDFHVLTLSTECWVCMWCVFRPWFGLSVLSCALSLSLSISICICVCTSIYRIAYAFYLFRMLTAASTEPYLCVAIFPSHKFAMVCVQDLYSFETSVEIFKCAYYELNTK